MAKPIRINLNPENSKTIREIQRQYIARTSLKFSLEGLCDRAIALGVDNLRKQLNLKPETK